MDKLTLKWADDFHVHLRQGSMSNMIVNQLRKGGACRVLVMPNLQPLITTPQQAICYRQSLQKIDPNVDYLMTLYLSTDLTVDMIREAASLGIVGVKSYPKGVTTHSESGVEDYTRYYPIFEAMQTYGLVLNIHGEIPSDPDHDICVLNAEEHFLKHLVRLHQDFPNLRIVMEHVTTAVAIDTILSLGETIAATITVHHLELTIDDVVGNCHGFCKPVAKYPRDRDALQSVIRRGHKKFFLGSDSAPHPRHLKECAHSCAGIFTSPYLLPYLATIFERLNCLEHLENFVAGHGSNFYRLNPNIKPITLVRMPIPVDRVIPYNDDEGQLREVVPYLAGQILPWSISEES
jgi:dihydroorotase